MWCGPRLTLFVLVGLLSLRFSPAAAATDPPLTEEAAVALALGGHPRLTALMAERPRLAGELARARQWVADNPELSGDWTRRKGGDDTTTDWEVAVDQRLEVAGQRRHRLESVRARLAALDAETTALRVEVAGQVRIAFTTLAIARDRERVAAEMVELNDKLVRIARARLAAGDVADLDVVLASLARSEAMRRRLEVQRTTVTAQRALADALGVAALPPLALPAVGPPPAPAALGELLARLDDHPQRVAMAGAARAAAADLALARAGRRPDLTVGGHVGREESRDTRMGVSLSLPLPLFHRRQAAIGAAQSEAQRLDAEGTRLRAKLAQAVGQAHAALTSTLAELDLFDREILPGLSTHLRRIHRAYELGEMDLTTLTITQAQVVAARFDHLQTLADGWRARIDLDRAIGIDPMATETPNVEEQGRNPR